MSRLSKKQHFSLALLGLVFGFFLSRIGFSSYSEVHKMFAFTDLRLFLTFAFAVVFSGIGFIIFAPKKLPSNKPFHKGVFVGSILFGIGWSLTGACPAVAIVQLGEGKMLAIFTLLGIVIGNLIYELINRRYLHLNHGTCGS